MNQKNNSIRRKFYQKTLNEMGQETNDNSKQMVTSTIQTLRVTNGLRKTLTIDNINNDYKRDLHCI